MLFLSPRLPVLHFEAARLPLEMQWFKTFQVVGRQGHDAFHDRKAATLRACELQLRHNFSIRAFPSHFTLKEGAWARSASECRVKSNRRPPRTAGPAVRGGLRRGSIGPCEHHPTRGRLARDHALSRVLWAVERDAT